MYNASIYAILTLCFSSFFICYAERSIQHKRLGGRSYCIHCKHQLSPMDIIPILGYLINKGHCRYCLQPIPRLYFWGEILGLCFGTVVGLANLSPIKSILMITIFLFMLVLSVEDIISQTIFQRHLLELLLIIIIYIYLYSTHTFLNHVGGSLIVSIPLFMIAILAPNKLGFGDVFFMAIGGLLLGFYPATYAFLIAMLAALATSIFLMAFHHAHLKTSIPLVPFLSLGILILLLYSTIFSQYI